MDILTIKKIYAAYLSCDGRVTTDSRRISGGEMFFALKGENFDGDLFVAKALEAGASYAVASVECELDDPRVFKVASTLETLWGLAAYHREKVNIPTVGENGVLTGGNRVTVIGLTGTNGKTTTKELINAVLSTTYNVCATEGNLNNNIGVPLTVLKLRGSDMAAEKTHDLALVEMGASHPGDIDELTAVAHPDTGLITNVGKAHLLGFGSFEGVKKTKGELYDYILSKGWKKVFVNEDNPHLVGMASDRMGLETVPYGLKYSGSEVLVSDDDHPFLRIRIGERVISTNLVGAYNADNVLAAIAVGDFFGVPFETAAAAIEAYVPSNNRSMMKKTGRNTLIVDAYNANPSSMDVALDNFALVSASRKIAMLGDMRELGAESAAEHARIAAKALAIPGCEVLFVGSEFAAAAGSSARCFASSDELAAWLRENPVDGATVLIKGSNSLKMINVIPEL
ncbi:MAG: UDP-N-acetylmuramoyl-tripeptide--D-alanyl-D-alanine ligase [Bacteroidales bacterium]|nr:UDP-N-acetylmuramoyl-tripeptide--D-alanyl-D-alanine ligase [Bacteroidales bacterium]